MPSFLIQHSVFSIQHFPLAFTWPIRLQYFSGLVALALFAALGTVVVLLGTWSLAGLGPGRKWTAIGVRLAVLLLFVLILGGVRWQKQVRDVEVMVLQDQSDSVYRTDDWPGKLETDPTRHRELDAAVNDYLRQIAQDPTKKSDDRIGLITFKDYVQVVAMPNKELQLDSRGTPPKGQGTNIAAAIQLALATMTPDAMHRLVLISDGNPNLGDTEAAINAAVAQHVPIDVMPLRYDVQNDVSVERFVAPPWKRIDEPYNLSVVLRNTNPVPVAGKLRVSERYPDHDDDLVLEPAAADPKVRSVTIPANGLKAETVRVPPTHEGGVHRFRAVFTPDVPGTGGVSTSIPGSTTKGSGGVNAIEDNDSREAFTFVKGKGQVLYVDNTGSPGGNNPGSILVRTMKGVADDPAQKGEGIDLRPINIDQFPSNLIELQNYDAVILNNVPRGAVIDKDSGGIEHATGLSETQDAMLRTYVHDMGGGLVMIGGPDAFGAGGWGGSEVEKILPVDMDIPAQRQVGKGALVMIMHSCEMPQGNYWGVQCAKKAVEALSSRDDVGIISYDWGKNNPQGIGGAQWDFQLAPVSDRSAVNRAIQNMQLGDMPSFDDAMNLAINGVKNGPGLAKNNARHKHIIIISDGDPQAPAASLMQQCRDSKISVSTVTVFPHGGGAGSNGKLPPVMDDIPKNAWPGGKAFGPIEDNPNQLPQIFIKQATIVKRSLITEDEKGLPITLRDPADDMVKGIPNPPPSVFGMVLTSAKNDPKVEMPLSTGKMKDPILAHWQTGLGKTAVWTSDAHNKWALNWVGSPEYAKLWAQIIRGVSRPPMSNNFDVKVNVVGGKGEVTVEALDKDAAALNFLNFTGHAAGGTNLKDPPQELRLIQTGPGTYKATFDGRGEGAYVVALNYRGRSDSGFVMGGTVVNTSPEASDLKSNEVMLEHIRAATGGRNLEPFVPRGIALFDRAGLIPGTAPLPVWDVLLPFLVALIIVDVAIRRIAWDWRATKRMALAVADRLLAFSAVRKVETRQSLDALRGVRDKVAETHYGAAAPSGAGTPPPRPPPGPRPDPKAKFVAKGAVEGDITQVVGGATDKPIPPPPKKIEPKGGSGAGGHIGGLMAAKKRAQQQIKDKEQPPQ